MLIMKSARNYGVLLVIQKKQIPKNHLVTVN